MYLPPVSDDVTDAPAVSPVEAALPPGVTSQSQSTAEEASGRGGSVEEGVYTPGPRAFGNWVKPGWFEKLAVFILLCGATYVLINLLRRVCIPFSGQPYTVIEDSNDDEEGAGGASHNNNQL